MTSDDFRVWSDLNCHATTLTFFGLDFNSANTFFQPIQDENIDANFKIVGIH